jgi:hypothetical protein
MDDTFLPFFLHHVALPRFHQHKMQGKLPGVEVRETRFSATEKRDGRAPCSVNVANLGATCGGCVELGNKSRWSEASLLETMCRTSCQPGESIVSTGHKYSDLSVTQIVARAKYQRERAASARLHTLKVSRHFATAAAKINDYDRILSLLSHKYPAHRPCSPRHVPRTGLWPRRHLAPPGRGH